MDRRRPENATRREKMLKEMRANDDDGDGDGDESDSSDSDSDSSDIDNVNNKGPNKDNVHMQLANAQREIQTLKQEVEDLKSGAGMLTLLAT